MRPPNASRATMLDDGLMIVVTVLSLNLFGGGLRDALDPKAKIRLEH